MIPDWEAPPIAGSISRDQKHFPNSATTHRRRARKMWYSSLYSHTFLPDASYSITIRSWWLAARMWPLAILVADVTFEAAHSLIILPSVVNSVILCLGKG